MALFYGLYSHYTFYMLYNGTSIIIWIQLIYFSHHVNPLIGDYHLIIFLRRTEQFLIAFPGTPADSSSSICCLSRRSHLPSCRWLHVFASSIRLRFVSGRICRQRERETYVLTRKRVKKKRKNRASIPRPLAWLQRNGSALAHYSTMPRSRLEGNNWVSDCSNLNRDSNQ